MKLVINRSGELQFSSDCINKDSALSYESTLDLHKCSDNMIIVVALRDDKIGRKRRAKIKRGNSVKLKVLNRINSYDLILHKNPYSHKNVGFVSLKM